MATTQHADPASSLDKARALAARGWRPFPLDHPSLPVCAGTGRKCRENRERYGDCKPKDRGKHPVNVWSTQTASAPPDGMLKVWFGEEARNIGLAAGPSGLLIIDEDEQDALTTLAADQGEELPTTYRVLTSRGWHWYFLDPDNEFGNSAGALEEYGCDVRGGHGAGGYVVAAGSTHHTGVEYVAEDDHAEVAPLPDWIKKLLRMPSTGKGRGDDDAEQPTHEGPWTDEPRYGYANDLRGQYDRHLAAVRALVPAPGRKPNGGEFRHRLYLAALDGWRLVHCGLADEISMLNEIRRAIEVVWGAPPDDNDRHIVYTEAQEKAVESPWRALDPFVPPPASSDADGGESSSWEPIDLADEWDDNIEPEQATLLKRVDGPCLLYPGRTHSVYGESESGKSWIALILVAQVLMNDGTALYIDHESDKDPIKGRLRALGVTKEQARQLAYVRPDGPRDAAWLRLLERQYTVAVIDGVTVAISTDGRSSDSPDETSHWLEEVPRKLEKCTGAAVLTVDHVTKARDGRGRFAVGSQQKLNAISGAAYTARVHKPFGRGEVGELVMRITKDRPGGIRPNCGPPGEYGTQEAARVVLDATDPKNIRAEIRIWSEAGTEEHDLPFGAPIEMQTSWRDVDSALPDDIVTYEGKGKSALNDLVRFMRHTADGGVGQSLADAKRELLAIKNGDGSERHNRWAVQRAWGALVDLNRLQLADGVNSDTGRSLWVKRDGE